MSNSKRSMFLFSLFIFLLLSNAVASRQDKAIILSSILYLLFIAKNKSLTFNPENITINSSLTTSISVLTLLVLFICVPGEWFNIVSILSFFYSC